MPMSKAQLDAANKKAKQQAEEEQQRRHSSHSPNAGATINVLPEDKNEKDSIIDAYKNQFGGKPGFKEPIVNRDGSITLTFPNKGDAEKFFIGEAQKGTRMIIVDAVTQTVMGYSNGDGTLYHADGNECKSGDALKPSKIAAKDFTLPEPKSRLGSSM